MNRDELIAMQQLELETYKKNVSDAEKSIKKLKAQFYSIGKPLNDNVLKFNKYQIAWCQSVYNMIEDIEIDLSIDKSPK